jgi:hypothetical protein
MEYDLNILKLEDNLIFYNIEDDLNILKMEDNINYFLNGRWTKQKHLRLKE